VNTHTCLRLFLFAAVVTAFACAKAQSGEHRVYSNVKYNEEGGDLLGTELDLTINDGRVDGTLKIYQGGCADPVRLSGSSPSGKLHASGQGAAFGKVEITGTLLRDSLNGSMRLEKAQSSEKIRLVKIAKPHC
jgi:hypothetical protein